MNMNNRCKEHFNAQRAEAQEGVDEAEGTLVGRLSLAKRSQAIMKKRPQAVKDSLLLCESCNPPIVCMGKAPALRGGWCISKLGCTGCKDERRNPSGFGGLPYRGQIINGQAGDAWDELSYRSEIGSAGASGKGLLQPEANGFARSLKQQLLLGAQGPGGGELHDGVEAASQHPFQINMASTTSFHEITLRPSTPMQTAPFIDLKAIEPGGLRGVSPCESGGTATPVSATSSNAAYCGVWGAAVRADCVSNPQGILQAMLFSHAQSVLSATELHALRHVLQLERTGPLEEDAAQLVQVMADPLSAEPLSASEHKSLLGLLKRRGVTALPAARNHRLKGLLVRAIASSLSPEQQDCAKAAWLGAAQVTPMSPSGLSRLAAFLNGEGWEGTDVQAAIEDQLKLLCTLPQQQAIHRLLFLEDLWSLSLEQRELLEALQVQQPAVSAAQGFEVSPRTEQPQREESADSNVCEALHVLLQFLAATLTSHQRAHLFALLHMGGTPPGHTERAQPSEGREEHQSAIYLFSARLVTLVRRVLDAQPLTPAECRELQEGVLRALGQLVSEEQLQALQRVINLDDRAPDSEENLRALEDLRLALTFRQISSACLDQLEGSGLRATLLHCLGRTLSSEQLWVLTRVLDKWKPEKNQDQQAQPPQSVPPALDASTVSGGSNWKDGSAEPAHIDSRRKEATELLGCASKVLGKLNDLFVADAQRNDEPSQMQPAMTQGYSRQEESNKARWPAVDEAPGGQQPSASFNFGVKAAKKQSGLAVSELDDAGQASRDREGMVLSSGDRPSGGGPSKTGVHSPTPSGILGPVEVSTSLLGDDRGVGHAKPTGEPEEKHALEDAKKGYLKRCPCLYHQQQDRLEEEERRANLELLESLKCASFMRREQTAEDLADDVAWSISLDETSFPTENQGAQDPAHQQDTAETGAPFESGSFGSSLQPFSRQEDEPLLPSRGRSMPLSVRRGGSSPYKLQGHIASLSGASSSREKFGVGRSIAHTRSLGATLHHGPEAGRSRSAPVSPPQARHAGGSSRSQVEFSFERSLRSSCVFDRAGKSYEDKSIAAEEDKSTMQKRALEKAQQLAQDAKVALWIFLKKQVQPANSGLGPQLVDMINLQHLSARTLPPGKGWQTRSLLRMIEGIVALVCSLRGEEAGSSLLSPLITLAQQTHAENCDLAIHAEVENARQALLLLDASSDPKPLAQQVKDGTADALETNVEKVKRAKSQRQTSEADEDLGSNIGEDADSYAAQASGQEAPEEADDEGAHKDNDTQRESKEKPFTSKLSEKFKQAALIDRGPVIGRQLRPRAEKPFGNFIRSHDEAMHSNKVKHF
ncbi:hypothetical protein Emed_002764 [Eimeria media]